MIYCKTCGFKDQLSSMNVDTMCSHCIPLLGDVPSGYIADEETKCKKILADMVGGDVNDSLHTLATKLLFGEFVNIKDKFQMVSVELESKMSPERFKELLDELDGNSLQTIKEKNARYAKNGDCLHNFRSGSAITRKTPAQTCWGYMSKHLTSLLDKVEANDFSDREDFLEKCQDTINYIRFLWCIGNDELDKNKEKESK